MNQTNTVLIKEIKHNVIKEALESNKLRLTNSNDIEQVLFFIDQLHYKDDGFICIGQKDKAYKKGKDGYVVIEGNEDNKSWSQWHLKFHELKSNLTKVLHLKDLYLSVNSFCLPKRKAHLIWHLNAFFIDLDYYNIPELKGKTAKEVLAILRKNGCFKFAEPSFCVDSGNGLYIFWLIDNAPKQMSVIYKKIQDKIFEMFKDYGADPQAKDLSRVLRLPGTVNSKTGRKASIILNDDASLWENKVVIRYDIKDLSKRVLPSLPYTKDELEELRKQRRKAKKEREERLQKNKELKKNNKDSDSKKSNENSKVKGLYNLHKLYHTRMDDLETLQELRGASCEGYRETMCYMYRLFALHFYRSTEKALAETLKFNRNFKKPLDEDAIHNETVSAEESYNNYVKAIEEYMSLESETKPALSLFLWQRHCNLYSNKTIVGTLLITEEEMKGLKTLMSSTFRNHKYYSVHKEVLIKKAKERYRSKVELTKQDKIEIELEKIRSLIAEGFTQKEIADKLNISIRTVKVRYKMLKENISKCNIENVIERKELLA